VHHCVSLRNMKILSFENFIKFSVLKLMYKCLQVLSERVVALRAVGSRPRGAKNGNCQIPKCNTSFGQTAFSVQGTKAWNWLPTELKGETNWVLFKNNLKDSLIRGQKCDHRSSAAFTFILCYIVLSCLF